MSKVSRVAGKIHKWLALLMAIQIIFWFVSGLFFALAPIEWVRSEHMIAEQPKTSVPTVAAAAGLHLLQAKGLQEADRIELHTLLGRPVALVRAGENRPRLYELANGSLISPIPAAFAIRIAEADHLGTQRATAVAFVQNNSPEYRGALPAWRVDFNDGANRSLYVAADTGVVAARRSTLWRTFDFLWSLHIMDFKDHEDFNTPLLVIATTLGFTVVLTGIVMLPSRLGWTARLRKKRRLERS